MHAMIELHLDILRDLAAWEPRERVANELQARLLAVASLARLKHIAKAVNALAPLGLPAEVAALGRIVCEAALHLQWIAADPEKQEERAALWIDHVTLKGAATARRWKELGVPDRKAGYESVEQAEREVRARRGLPDTRMLGLTIKGAAEETGPGAVEFYDLYYRTLCLSAHADPTSALAALGNTTDGDMVRALAWTNASCISMVEASAQVLGRASDFAAVRDSAMTRMNVNPASVPD